MEMFSGSGQCLEEYGAVSLLSASEGVTFAFFSLHFFTLFLSFLRLVTGQLKEAG